MPPFLTFLSFVFSRSPTHTLTVLVPIEPLVLWLLLSGPLLPSRSITPGAWGKKQKSGGIVHHRSQGFLFALLIASFGFVGCSGLVAGNNGNPPPPSTLVITNIQAGPITTSSSQVAWITNVPANSSVDYGTTTAYGSSTPVDSAMLTSHQMTVSGLAAGTTYYYQVNSTDSKGDHGHGGNKFNTGGFSLSGTINPATGGSGSTVALSGAAGNATTTAD